MNKITKLIPVILSVLFIIACNKSTTPPASNQSTSSNCYNTSPLLLDVIWCTDYINDSVLVKFTSDGIVYFGSEITSWAPVVTNCNNVIADGTVIIKILKLTSDSMKLIDGSNDTVAFHKIDIVGNPIKIGNIEVAQFDFPRNPYDYYPGKILGEGWRLPSVSELNTMYLNKNKIGNFKNYYYMTNEYVKV